MINELQEIRKCKACGVEQNLKNCFSYHSATKYYSRKCKNCTNKERRDSHIPKLREKKTYYKVCNKCGISKERSSEFFLKKKQNFHNVCIDCNETRKLEVTRKFNPKENFELKICTICKIPKETGSNFYYFKNTGYYSFCCRDCDKKRKQEVKLLRTPEKILSDKKISHEYRQVRKKHVTLSSRYKRVDFLKGLENDLTLEFIKEQISKTCVYCGFPPTGLDRIDNEKGHLISNCVPCCAECNTARNNNFSHEEMLIIGKTIREIKLKRIN